MVVRVLCRIPIAWADGSFTCKTGSFVEDAFDEDAFDDGFLKGEDGVLFDPTLEIEKDLFLLFFDNLAVQKAN